MEFDRGCNFFFWFFFFVCGKGPALLGSPVSVPFIVVGFGLWALKGFFKNKKKGGGGGGGVILGIGTRTRKAPLFDWG